MISPLRWLFLKENIDWKMFLLSASAQFLWIFRIPFSSYGVIENIKYMFLILYTRITFIFVIFEIQVLQCRRLSKRNRIFFQHILNHIRLSLFTV